MSPRTGPLRTELPLTGLPLIDADALDGLLGPVGAVDALEAALRGGLDPGAGPARSSIAVPGGELLVMPAQYGDRIAVKLAGVAPGNPALGLPRITGTCLLLDARTLLPLALFDAPGLTALRTSAVSALAVRHLAPAAAEHLLLFGAGPQAHAHLRAVAAVRPLRRVTVVGRDRDRVEALLRAAGRAGLRAGVGAPEDVRGADVVCCCTTARTPLFDGAEVAAHAVVVAVGSHEPDARETDSVLVGRSAVVVEDRATAFREAGDLLVPLAEGGFTRESVHADLAELVTGAVRPPVGRPSLFKSVGMAWEDLVVAAAAYDRSG